MSNDDMVVLWDGSVEPLPLVDDTLEALAFLRNDSEEVLSEVVDYVRELQDDLSDVALEKAKYVRLFEDGKMSLSVRNIIINSVVEDCTHDVQIIYPVAGNLE